MSKQIEIGGALLFLFLLNADASLAAGAFAEGVARDGNHGIGWVIGTAVNARNEQDAQRIAVEGCKKLASDNSDRPIEREARKLCHPVAIFKNKCVAAAADPKDDSPGFAWSVGVTHNQAINESLNGCRRNAGPDRQSFCKTILLQCDGTAK